MGLEVADGTRLMVLRCVRGVVMYGFIGAFLGDKADAIAMGERFALEDVRSSRVRGSTDEFLEVVEKV